MLGWAPRSAETLRKVRQSLFPIKDIQSFPNFPVEDVQFSTEEVIPLIGRLQAGKSPGVYGLRVA